MKRLLPAILLLALLAGCSTATKKDTGLGIELSSLEQAANGTVTAQMILINPSVVAFNIAGSTHKLYIDGHYAGQLTVSEPLGLAAQSQSLMSAVLVPDKGTSLTAPSRHTYRLETELKLRLYADAVEYTKLAASGSVNVSNK